MGNVCSETKQSSKLVKSKLKVCQAKRNSIAQRATQSTQEDEQPRNFSKQQFQSIKYFGVIGKGGQSQVQLISIMQINKQFENEHHFYALKAIEKNHKDNFQLTINKISKSKFLCPLKYIYQADKNDYMIMELAEGGTLADYLNYESIKGKQFLNLGQDMFRFLFAGIIIGLQYLHQSGFIYRDLKSENILLDSRGYPWLTDFGLSQIKSSVTTKEIKGTIFYLAPEVVNKSQYDKGVDLWALGVLLYSVAFGQYPYSKQEVLSPFFKRICNHNQLKYNHSNKLISPELKDLINKLLRVNKQDRIGYQNYSQIKQHNFFQGVNWKEIEFQRLKSPLHQLVNKYNIKNKYKTTNN